MSKCVFRTDLKLQPVGESLVCIEPIEMFSRPDVPTVEQCVQLLVADDEICLGMSDRRKIMRGPRHVGYILIVEERDCDPCVGARRVGE